ncbi:helix-turn-helix domain-containing protein [Streptomyces roseolilacinus]|uniref:Transcriptional regulator n=1 Tax=Streptomyces roseolilacinus TaxID=66904 RepID=A0A918EL56_9ACTN|nr:helix-turn-helix transcriptional regulator [Streptomyces roseolilacinus]GGQ21166.1 transcriptional regulator [Streptomyces roseolilacinus]
MGRDDGEGCDVTGAGLELSEGLQVFGAVLKSFRQAARLTQESFAPKVRYSAHYIAKIEQGKRFPPCDLPERVEPVLGETAASVLKAAAKKLSRRSGLASWFQHWVEIEEEALTLYAYECRVVPGLLQAEPYARKVLESHLPPVTDEQVEARLAARLDRQRLLSERQNTSFGFIIEQAVIERGFGGPDVTRHLVDHLLTCARSRNVELLVMPTRGVEHAGVYGPMYLAETRAHEWVGYVENQETSLLITDRNQVSGMLQRYGRMRSQALDPEASMSLLEHMRGAP